MSGAPETSTIETASMVKNNSAINNEGNVENEGNTIHYNNTISEDEVFLNTRNIADQRDDNPDTVDFHVNQGQHDNTQNSELSPIHTEAMLGMHCAQNEMLSYYNHIEVGSFKEIFRQLTPTTCRQFYKL